MSAIKYRKRVPKVLQAVLNTHEIHRTFTSQHDVDKLNTLLDESVVIMNSGLSADITTPVVLRNGLEKYVKKNKTIQPKVLFLEDVTTLYLAYSKANVTTLEYKRRVVFLTEVLPTLFKSCHIPLKLDEITSKHLYILSQYMGREPNPKIPTETRKPQTVNRYIKLIKGMVNYGHSTGLYFLPTTMPTLTLSNSPEASRVPLNSNEYEALCNNLNGEALLLLDIIYLSGLRPSELHKCCVSTVEGVVCFDLSEPKEPLKTKASYRRVPIHNKLIPQLETIKALTHNDIKRLSREVNNTIKEVLHNPLGKSLYSARHSVVTRLINKGVSVERVQAIVGHSSSASMTMGVYHGGFELEVLREDINLL